MRMRRPASRRAAHRSLPVSFAPLSFARVRPTLIALHRWIGLVLTPIFLVIILSGAVLSVRPMLGSAQPRAGAGASVDASALAALVDRLEAGGQVSAVSVADGGRAVSVTSSAPEIAGTWDLATRAHTPAPAGGIDVFRTAENLHKSLLLGLGIVVEAASFLMLAIMVAGPFLAWLRFRNSLIGWHMAVGWCLLPVTLVAPVTAAMLILGIGTGPRPQLPRVKQPVAIGAAIATAARELDTSRLVMARRFRGGTVMIRVAGPGGGNFVVTDTGVTPLVGGPGLVKQIHEGTWAGAWSGSLNLAISIALAGLTVTGFVSWFRRWRRDRAAPLATGAEILVAHASQTGTAARLAAATCEGLVRAGEKATIAPLGAVRAQDLARFRLVLLVAATTGEGEVPAGARHVAGGLKPGALDGVKLAVLGLGDRTYTNFCGGARALRAALLAAGAVEAMEMREADGEPSAAWVGWMDALRAELGVKCDVPSLPPVSPPVTLTLAARERLDVPPPAGAESATPRDATQETWRIVLESARDLDFRPGDLVRLSPGGGERERSYSVGSSSRVDPRRIELTVRLHAWTGEDGAPHYGRVSGFLLREAAPGGQIEARLDPHPGFNPPADPQWPVVMIGAGSGIAPFPGFITERRASGRAGPAWLLFGNRHRAGDFLWRDLLEDALRDGTLTRLDTAFSRDPDDGAHVQQRLKENAGEVYAWLMERKAVVYVCGRRAMARGVEEALAGILASEGGLGAAEARAEIGRWLAEGRIRVDTFD